MYLEDHVTDLIDNGDLDAAFDLVELVFREVLSVDIDDDGDIEAVADNCVKYWKAVFRHPEANQKAFFDRIERLACRTEATAGSGGDQEDEWYDADLARMLLTDLLHDGFTDPECLRKSLGLIDAEMEDCGEYRLKQLFDQRLEVMDRLDCTDREKEAFFQKYRYLPFVRARKLDELEKEGCWDEALALIGECKRLDAGREWLLCEYEKRKIRILKAKWEFSANGNGSGGEWEGDGPGDDERDRKNYTDALMEYLTALHT